MALKKRETTVLQNDGILIIRRLYSYEFLLLIILTI